MKLYNLGKVSWEESQLIYHSLALLDREARVLNRNYCDDSVELEVVIDGKHLNKLVGQHGLLEVLSTSGRSQSNQ